MQCHGKCRLIHPRRIKCDKLSDYFPLYYFSAKYFRYKSKILLSLHVQWLTLIPITHLFSFTTHLRPQGYYNRHAKLSFDILHDCLSKTLFFSALDDLAPRLGRAQNMKSETYSSRTFIWFTTWLPFKNLFFCTW